MADIFSLLSEVLVFDKGSFKWLAPIADKTCFYFFSCGGVMIFSTFFQKGKDHAVALCPIGNEASKRTS